MKAGKAVSGRLAQSAGFRWTLGKVIGQGAFGTVHVGFNHDTGQVMAVKVFLDNRIEQHCTQEKELSLYQRLSHPNIVQYLGSDYDEEKHVRYIFLEFVGGGLANVLNAFGKLSEEVVKSYTRQILQGLVYLHDQGIAHRDLKGANILISNSGVVKMADFGAASAFHHDNDKSTGMKSLQGSLYWIAPEVLGEKGYGLKADIWSLGCTVIEMLTASHPWPEYRGSDQWRVLWQIAKTKTGPPRPEGCSPMALDFLDKCLNCNPRLRLTAAELLEHPFVYGNPNA